MMNHHYRDIRDRVDDAPLWYDEHAVPRYCTFSPNEVANIYAKECVLLLIRCQGCDQRFKVAMSWDDMSAMRHGIPRLRLSVFDKTIHYGDPPNIGCCPAGPTMNSFPLRVLEFWEQSQREWVRRNAREVSLSD